MHIRSVRERVIQTLSFEAGGILLATPLYMLVFGSAAGSSVLLLAAMSIAVMVWSPLHNTVFDRLEWRLARRVASDRPHPLRLLHAASHELSTIVVTLPIIMMVGGHGFWEAVAVDLGITLFYAAYAYLFHLAFDRLRPVVVVRDKALAPAKPRNLP